MTFESEGFLIVAIYIWLPPASYVVFSDNSGQKLDDVCLWICFVFCLLLTLSLTITSEQWEAETSYLACIFH